MKQVVNDFQISLSNILIIDLFLSHSGITIFLEQKKIIESQQTHKAFSITRDSNIFSTRSEIFSLKNFTSTSLKIIVVNFTWRL